MRFRNRLATRGLSIGRSACVTLLLLAIFLTLPRTTSAQAPQDSTLIYENNISSTFGVSQPLTDGEHVIWESTSVSVHSFCTSVRHVTFADREETGVIRIAAGSAVAIDDGYLLAETRAVQCEDNQPDSRLDAGMFLVDLADGSSQTLFDNADNVEAVAIDYPYIAWITAQREVGEVQVTVWGMNVTGDSAPTLIETETIPSGGDIFLSVEHDTVYWITTFGSDHVGNAGQAQIGGTTTYFMSMHDTTGVALAGDLLVTITEGRPLLHNLSNGSKKWLSDLETEHVAIDGRYVFWSEEGGNERYVVGYDALTNTRFRVWQATVNESDRFVSARFIHASGGAVVWGYAHYNTWMSAIHGAPIADRLPSAYQSDPSTTSPDWTYYPESGHYLANDFRDFWNNNGGLPVFGFPMTEEFDYLSPDTGNSHAAQMTERQRFEWHPDNIGTPYAVLLGRLGETILQGQGRDWTTFEKADPTVDHYFAETGHAIAPEFYGYWSSHGLDLGQAGVGFDESLALFGYPLSEPMMETNADGDTVLTQYFERAVFEFHPDNPEASQVLLRRLGAELMDSWGW